MSVPHSSCSDQEQDRPVHESRSEKLTLLKPLSSDRLDRTGEEKLWSESLHFTDLAYGSAEKRSSDELSCELGLGVVENPRIACRICHRHFSSGRALGGHMRVHGPLFHLSGNKRKLDPLERGQGASHGNHMDISDSKGSELSLLSMNLSEKPAFAYDGIDDPTISSDSDGEAVHDAQTSEIYRHKIGRVEGSQDDHMNGFGTNKHMSLKLGSSYSTLSKRNPLYTHHHIPTKSPPLAEDQLSMRMFLAGKDDHPTSRAPVISSMERSKVCSECGKAFWSSKALFGHMRCHPERNWRGILPPDDSFMAEERIRLAKRRLLAADNRLSLDLAFDLASDMEGKEFRKVKAEEVTESDFHGDGVVNKILKETEGMGNGLSEERRWPTGKRSRRKLTEGFQQACSSTDQALSESGSVEDQFGETPNFLLMLAEAARKVEREFLHDRQGQEGEGESPHDMSAKQTEATAGTTFGIAKYECSTCKKAFNSHQALGGHRASHRKMKGCFARNEIEEQNPLRDYLWQHYAHPSAPAGAEKDMKQQQRKEHECSICHRVFSTGQALGGHKRCHYTGEKAAEAAAVTFTSSNKLRTSEDGHWIVEDGGALDLNLPAPINQTDENADLSLPSHWFDENVNEEAKQQRLQELTLAPCLPKAIMGSQRQSSPWELAAGAAVALLI